MTQDPTPYDLLQDAAIEGLQDIVTPHYQPPSDREHSFPVVGQGVSSEMYRQMSLAQGDGVIVTDDGHRSHNLQLLPGGASETNAQNRLILTTAQNTGRGEAILAGFYHVFYQDMYIDFPPVTTATTYHVCITYDPRNEDTEHGPLKIETYAGTPPSTHGRRHIVLHTVHRQPNQLLTDAVREMHRQYISPTIAVFHRDRLPEATDVLYGSLAVKNNQTVDGVLRPGTGELYEARGEYGWQNLLVGEPENLVLVQGWEPISTNIRPRARLTHKGVMLEGRVRNGTSTHIMTLPPKFRPRVTKVFQVPINTGGGSAGVWIEPDGPVVLNNRNTTGFGSVAWVSFDGIEYPLD